MIITIGEVLKPQGIRGEVKIRPITDDPERFRALDSVLIGGVSFLIKINRIHEGFVFARLGDTASREAAEKFRGKMIEIPREKAVNLSEDENFIVDLIGLSVFDNEDTELGNITEIMQPGANDVYVVKGKSGEILLPALKKLVLSVDIPKGRMVVDARVMEEVAVFAD